MVYAPFFDGKTIDVGDCSVVARRWPTLADCRPPYRFIVDNGSEGWKFGDGDFDTVDSAVKAAVANSYGSKFLIVSVVDWKATE